MVSFPGHFSCQSCFFESPSLSLPLICVRKAKKAKDSNCSFCMLFESVALTGIAWIFPLHILRRFIHHTHPYKPYTRFRFLAIQRAWRSSASGLLCSRLSEACVRLIDRPIMSHASSSPQSPSSSRASGKTTKHDGASDANIRNFAPVARIMKTALPENAKIAKEAKECMQECVSEFISFITSEGKQFIPTSRLL